MNKRDRESYEAQLDLYFKELKDHDGVQKFKKLIGLMMGLQSDICQRADVISETLRSEVDNKCNVEYSTLKKSIKIKMAKEKEEKEKQKTDYRSSLLYMKEMTLAKNEVGALSAVVKENVEKIEEPKPDADAPQG